MRRVGYSLIELVVTLAIILVVGVGLSQVFPERLCHRKHRDDPKRCDNQCSNADRRACRPFAERPRRHK